MYLWLLSKRERQVSASSPLLYGHRPSGRYSNSLPRAHLFSRLFIASPLDKDCSCSTCKNFSRAFLHNLAKKPGLPFASSLVSLHNVAYTQRLTRQIREAIKAQTFPQFVSEFVSGHYPQVPPRPFTQPSSRACLCLCDLVGRYSHLHQYPPPTILQTGADRAHRSHPNPPCRKSGLPPKLRPLTRT